MEELPDIEDILKKEIEKSEEIPDADEPPPHPETDPLKLILVTLFVGLLGGGLLSGAIIYMDKYAGQERPCDKLVMYSTSWCGYCRDKRREFKAAGIKYTEYMVDRNRSMNTIFEEKARKAGVRIAYPRFEVNGKMLKKNHSTKYLQKRYDLCTKS